MLWNMSVNVTFRVVYINQTLRVVYNSTIGRLDSSNSSLFFIVHAIELKIPVYRLQCHTTSYKTQVFMILEKIFILMLALNTFLQKMYNRHYSVLSENNVTWNICCSIRKENTLEKPTNQVVHLSHMHCTSFTLQ